MLAEFMLGAAAGATVVLILICFLGEYTMLNIIQKIKDMRGDEEATCLLLLRLIEERDIQWKEAMSKHSMITYSIRENIYDMIPPALEIIDIGE